MGVGPSPLERIRRVIARIPRGRVATYGQLAALAGFPGAARLSVRALQRSEGLPWQRVVGAGGRIALPGEAGREQRLRLMLEGVRFRGERVRMDLHSWRPRGPVRRPRAYRQLGPAVRLRRRPGVVPATPDRSSRAGPNGRRANRSGR